MTLDEARQIVDSSVRCTNAVMQAFGLDKHTVPLTGSGCLSYLRAAGYVCTRLPLFQSKSLAQLKSETHDGSFLIATKGHAIAVIDGVLIDTMRMGWNSRKVEFAWRVTKNENI